MARQTRQERVSGSGFRVPGNGNHIYKHSHAAMPSSRHYSRVHTLPHKHGARFVVVPGTRNPKPETRNPPLQFVSQCYCDSWHFTRWQRGPAILMLPPCCNRLGLSSTEVVTS